MLMLVPCLASVYILYILSRLHRICLCLRWYWYLFIQYLFSIFISFHFFLSSVTALWTAILGTPALSKRATRADSLHPNMPFTCMCVCVREREILCVRECVRERACVWELVRERVRDCVRVWQRVWEREKRNRKRRRKRKTNKEEVERIRQ